MKKTIALILATLSIQLQAQELDLDWGAEIKVSKTMASPQILGKTDKLIYVFGSDNPKNLDDYYVSTFDQTTFDLKDRFELKKHLPEDMEDNSLEEVFMLEDRIVIISSSKTELVATTMDLKGKIIKNRIGLMRIEKDKSFSGYALEISGDKSKLLIVRKMDLKEKEKVSYHFLVYDMDLKKINQTKQTLPYNGDHFTFGTASINPSGDVYFTGQVLVDGPKRKFDTYKNAFYHLNTALSKPQLEDVNISTDGKVFGSILFSIGESEITLTGVYGKNKNAEYLEGVFKMVLDKSNYAVLQSSFQPFLKGLISRSVFDEKTSPGVSFGYRLEHILPGSNGDKFLVLHNEFSYFRSDEKGTDKYLYSYDIIVVKLNAENKIVWNTLINKNQYFRIPYFMNFNMGITYIEKPVYRNFKRYEDLLGYAILHKDNELVFIFNDHIKNIGTKNTDVGFNSMKKSYCAEVNLNLETGKFEKKEVFKSKEEETLMLPRNYTQVTEDAIITFAFKGDKAYSLGKVTLNK